MLVELNIVHPNPDSRESNESTIFGIYQKFKLFKKKKT